MTELIKKIESYIDSNPDSDWKYGKNFGLMLAANTIKKTEQEHIKLFRDFQIEWLTSHCDIEFIPEEEQIIVRFLKDTADSFIKESEADHGSN